MPNTQQQTGCNSNKADNQPASPSQAPTFLAGNNTAKNILFIQALVCLGPRSCAVNPLAYRIHSRSFLDGTTQSSCSISVKHDGKILWDLSTEGNIGNKESWLSLRSSVRRIRNQICRAVWFACNTFGGGKSGFGPRPATQFRTWSFPCLGIPSQAFPGVGHTLLSQPI